jgi:hypothetical protein
MASESSLSTYPAPLFFEIDCGDSDERAGNADADAKPLVVRFLAPDPTLCRFILFRRKVRVQRLELHILQAAIFEVTLAGCRFPPRFQPRFHAAALCESKLSNRNRRWSAIDEVPKKTLSDDGTGLLRRRRRGDSGRVTPPAPLQNYRLHDHKGTAPPRGICSLGGAAINTGPRNPPAIAKTAHGAAIVCSKLLTFGALHLIRALQ